MFWYKAAPHPDFKIGSREHWMRSAEIERAKELRILANLLEIKSSHQSVIFIDKKLTIWRNCWKFRHAMFQFASNTDDIITFTKEEAWEVPYARDAFDDFAGGHADENTLEFPFASTTQLKLLREAINAKLKAGSYSPQKETFELGDTHLPLPPFTGLLWGKPFKTFLYLLDPVEIAQLIVIADTTCMWTLRNNVIRMMFIRIILNNTPLTEFFSAPTDHLVEVMRNIYYAEITSVSRSGYYDFLDSNHSD